MRHRQETIADLTDIALEVVKFGVITSLSLPALRILKHIKNNPLSISQVSKDLKIDYKNAWRYSRQLYDLKLVDLHPSPKQSSKGTKVIISSLLKS